MYGNRAAKWTLSNSSETLYFNTMWTWHTDTGLRDGQYSKHIYLGETRVVTKQTSKLEASYGQSDEWHHRYYYHPDHLGSAQLVTDYEGNEYQRIEYTPYGELWVEKKSAKEEGLRYLPYKFTAKEQDEETGLYYYGARYLDAKYSRWMSTDPAVGEYMSGSSAGGGIYNTVNFSLYHYAGNNPVKYTDPTGMSLDDWQDNGDGTWTVKSEGAKLWDVWGANWDVLSGVTSEEEAKKIQVGQTYGFKQSTNNNTSAIFDDYSKELKERAKDSKIDVPVPTHEYVFQGITGFSNMVLGILGYVGVTAYGAAEEAVALKCNGQIDPSVGYSMMMGYSASSVLFADGFNLFVGAFQKKQKDSIFWNVFQNLITDPMVDVGKGLSKIRNKETEQRK